MINVTLENVILEISSSSIQLIPPDPVNTSSQELQKQLVVTGTVSSDNKSFASYTANFILSGDELSNNSLNDLDTLVVNKINEFFKSK